MEYSIDTTDLTQFNEQYETLQTQLTNYNKEVYNKMQTIFSKKLAQFRLIMNKPRIWEFREIFDGLEIEFDVYNESLEKNYHEIFYASKNLLMTKLNEYKKLLNDKQVNDLDESLDSFYNNAYYRSETKADMLKFYKEFCNKISSNKTLYMYTYFQNYLETNLLNFLNKYGEYQCDCHNVPCDTYLEYMDENDLLLFR